MDGSTGNDSTGTGAIGAPFKTIGHCTNSYDFLKAGDTVSIKAGTYQEFVNPKRDGTADNPVTIKAFGNGPVVIDNSPVLGTWTLNSANIWVTNTGFEANGSKGISNLVSNEVPLLPASVQWNYSPPYHDTSSYNPSNMHEGYFFYDWNTGLLYVWMPGGANPNTTDLHAVLWHSSYADSDNGIYMWNTSYNIFDGLTIQYATNYGISWLGDAGTGNNIYKNCVVKFSGNTGISGGPNAQIINNTVYFNVMQNWPRGRWNAGYGGWGGGVTSGSGTLFQGNTIHNNGGEGLISYLSNNMIYRGNIIYDNWSVNLYIDNESNILVENNLIYSHEPNYNDGINSGVDGINLEKRLRGMGIMTADEYYDGLTRLQNVTIRNNIILNCRRGYTHSADVLGSGMKYVNIYNNTIVTPSTVIGYAANVGSADNFIGINIPWNAGNNIGSVVANNIVVARNSANYALYSYTQRGNIFAGVTFKNNLFTNSAYSNPIHWGSDVGTTDDKTVADWQALTTSHYATANITGDPLLASIGAFTSPSYLMANTSPAKGAGTAPNSSTDYNGFSWASPPSLGAMEYASVPTTRLAASPNTFASNSGGAFAAKIFANMSGSGISVFCNLKGEIKLSVYNILGEKVKTIYSGTSNIDGYYYWNGENRIYLPTGLYFLQVQSTGTAFTRKLMIIR